MKTAKNWFPSKNQLTCVPAAETDDEKQNETQVVSDVATQSELSGLFKSKSLSDRGAWASRLDLEDPDQIRSCSNCHLALPLLTLRWHEVASQRHTAPALHMIEKLPE